ncbi:30S ribosomal protein S12 methylthiotransferase [Bacillus subtilis]|nr:30S ribosomal protein S12 methylthiotransferase [Bacillus subtilis]
MATVAFHTLGCKVNHYETEAIWQLFKEAAMKEETLNKQLMYMSLIHVRLQIREIKKAAK